jgi:hypothetical protein
METKDTMQHAQVSESQPAYEPPEVVTHRGDELVDELGPAQACTFAGSTTGCD